MELLHVEQASIWVQPLLNENEFMGDTDELFEAIVKETLDGFTSNEDNHEEEGDQQVKSTMGNQLAIVPAFQTVNKKKKKSKYTPEESRERKRKSNRDSRQKARDKQMDQKDHELQKSWGVLKRLEDWHTLLKDLTPDKVTEMNQLVVSIREISKEAEHLRKQNESLNEKVQESQKVADTFQQLYEEEINDPQYRDMDAIEYQLDTASFERQNDWNHFRYSPKSDLELSQSVVKYYREIEALQRVPINGNPIKKDGWTMCREVVEGDMIFRITRKYRDIDPLTVMQRIWADGTKSIDHYREKQPNMKRLQILQEIKIPGFEDQTYMIGRDVEDREYIYRTIYLFFRMATDRGYLIGCTGLNPSPEEQNLQRLGCFYGDKLRWTHVSYSVELNESYEVVHDGNSFVTYKGCELIWRGRAAYKDAEMAKERAANLFEAVLQWDEDVIDPSGAEKVIILKKEAEQHRWILPQE